MSQLISTRGHIAIPIVIGAGGLLSMSLIAYFLQNGTLPLWVISQHKIVNFTFTMQMMVLPISFAAMTLIYLYDRKGFKTFFRLGISFSKNNNWNFYGSIVAVSFTLGTTLLMSIGVTSQNGLINESFFTLIPLVLLFSVTNAWSEEIFSRFVIVVGLNGKIEPFTICWISAIIFGIPHFFGTPNGIFGVIMSGLLGWLLAKSVIDTKGIGWALFIHFLQDVVIFGAGAMIIAGTRR
jgi:membrane protease YdiL (CAAX protease family)